jgi:DNA-binding transcriptional regulator LsrR (DeoR family)
MRAVRVLDSGNVAALASQVGLLMTEVKLPAGSVVAIGWGRAVQSVMAAGLPKIPNVIVVPTMGGMHETESHFQINEFVRTAAEQMQSEPRFLYAPSIVSAELRTVLAKDPVTASILECWSRVDVALLGIGDFQRAARSYGAGVDNDDTDRVVGDVARHFFYENGQERKWSDQKKLMAISREQLRRIPLSIGMAIGEEKVHAILGAARSGMINALVTDTRAARHLLEYLERNPKERRENED